MPEKHSGRLKATVQAEPLMPPLATASVCKWDLELEQAGKRVAGGCLDSLASETPACIP